MTALAVFAGWSAVAAVLAALAAVYLLVGAGVARLIGFAVRRSEPLDRGEAWLVIASWPIVTAGCVAVVWALAVVGALQELYRGARRFLRWIGDVATG